MTKEGLAVNALNIPFRTFIRREGKIWSTLLVFEDAAAETNLIFFFKLFDLIGSRSPKTLLFLQLDLYLRKFRSITLGAGCALRKKE